MARKKWSYNLGGKKLPGGNMTSLGVGGAVEFTGNTHEGGGIMLDAQTEVEDGETMDKVSGKDYFFSNHLKVSGRTFADIHKQLLTRNAGQAEIEKLAQLQERQSGRSQSIIQAEYGGWRKMQEGGDREEDSAGSKVTGENAADIREAVKYTGKTPEELADEFGTNAIPGKYMKYLKRPYEGANEVILKVEYLTWDMANPYGLLREPSELAALYIASNTGQFKDGKYYADEDETGDIKFIDLSDDVKREVNRLQSTMEVIASPDVPLVAENTNNEQQNETEMADTDTKEIIKSDKYNYGKLDMKEYDAKVRKKYNISEEDWNALSPEDQVAKRDQWADEHYTAKEEGDLALKEREKSDAAYIEEANIQSRMDPYDMKSHEEMSTGQAELDALIEEGKGLQVGTPEHTENIRKRNELSNRLRNLNQASIDTETKARTAAEEDEGLGEGTYTDEEGNQWQKDPQGRWRVKYMNPSEFGEPNLDTEWTVLSPDSYPGEMNLTPYKEKKSMLQRVNESRSGMDALSLAAAAAQLVPAYMAYKETPDFMDTPGKMQMSDLDRVNYNAERTTNAADYRALNRAIELSGAGPGGLSNKMMAYNKKQMADMAITAQETRENTRIAASEAQMNQQAESTNIKNNMVVDEFNAAAEATTKDRKLEAVQNAMQSLAGMNRDRLQYMASESLAQATQGEVGTLNRFDMHVRASQISGTTDRTDARYVQALQSLQNLKT